MPANNAGSGTAIFSGVNGILVPNKGVASLDAAVRIDGIICSLMLIFYCMYRARKFPI